MQTQGLLAKVARPKAQMHDVIVLCCGPHSKVFPTGAFWKCSSRTLKLAMGGCGAKRVSDHDKESY